MKIIYQPVAAANLGDQLKAEVEALSGRGSVVRIAVAFARSTGILQLAPTLQDYRRRGGYVEVIIGVGAESITTKQSLELLLRFSDVTWAFHNPSATFHPKIYLLREGRRHSVAFLGSNNLTTGGLYTNYEVCVELRLDLTNQYERRTYRHLADIYQWTKKRRDQIRKIDSSGAIRELESAGLLVDETSLVWRRQGLSRSAEDRRANLFSSTPPPSPPPILEQFRHLLPQPRRGVVMFEATEGGEIEEERGGRARTARNITFVMGLDNRDTRQRKNYSREIYIPIAARDADPEFWGWPDEFNPSKKAGHPEWYVNVLVRPLGGRAEVATRKRLWHYEARDEFRFNNRELIKGSTVGNLLVVFARGGTFEGTRYTFEAAVIERGDPAFEVYQAACVNAASPIKSWGYLP